MRLGTYVHINVFIVPVWKSIMTKESIKCFKSEKRPIEKRMW